MLPRLLTAILLLLALADTGRADQSVFYTKGGAAVSGYDTVAYFTVGKAVRGRPEIAVHWKGATWRFDTLENRETFEANPRAYAPQYGGWCAYAVSRGHLDSGDPAAWRIVDGKLYLTHSPGVYTMWARDIPGNLRLGQANWPGVLAK